MQNAPANRWNHKIKSYLSSHVSEVIAVQQRAMKIIKENHNIYPVIAPPAPSSQCAVFLYSLIDVSAARADKY